MFASPLLGLWLRMPPVGARNEDAEVLADPEVRLSLTGRSGPLVVEIEYRVDQENARAFHNVMQEVQLSRQRNGAYGWSIARDIADPELWTERYHCPTWLDYLRQRNRSTQSERALHQRAMDFHLGPDPVRVRRMLERPFGSVRWKEDTPDRAANEVLPVATAAGAVHSLLRRHSGAARSDEPGIQRQLSRDSGFSLRLPRNDDQNYCPWLVSTAGRPCSAWRGFASGTPARPGRRHSSAPGKNARRRGRRRHAPFAAAPKRPKPSERTE